MTEHVKKAIEYMNGSYSCSQSVLCAFCDEAGLSHDEAKKLATPYAGGAKKKCGAVCAAGLVLEEKFKGEGCSTGLIAELEAAFKQKNGSVLCREIRGQNLRPCVGCVEDAATILDDLLTEF